jgi:hypothetical protein
MLAARGLEIEPVRDSLRLDIDRLLGKLGRSVPHAIPCDRRDCWLCRDPELRASAAYLNAA